jgi:hypothetical protein
MSGIVVGEVRANLNSPYHYPAQFSRLSAAGVKEIRRMYCAGTVAMLLKIISGISRWQYQI